MSLLCDRHCVTRREVLLFIIPADNSYPERFGVKPCKRKGKSIGMYNSIITKIYVFSSPISLVSLLFCTGAKHLQAWQADQMGACARQEPAQNWLALALTLHLDWASFDSVQPASKEVPRRFAPRLDALSSCAYERRTRGSCGHEAKNLRMWRRKISSCRAPPAGPKLEEDSQGLRVRPRPRPKGSRTG